MVAYRSGSLHTNDLDQKADNIDDLPINPEVWQVPYLIDYVSAETAQLKIPTNPTQNATAMAAPSICSLIL